MDTKQVLEEMRRRLEDRIQSAFSDRDANRGGGLCEASELVKEIASELGITLEFESQFVD